MDTKKFIKENNLKGPVGSPQMFLGKTTSFHPQGLLSEEIFGMEGSPERRSSFSWIDLNCKVIHPTIYDVLTKRIERKIDYVLSGEKSFKLNKNNELEESEEGPISGFKSFEDNIKKIKFRKNSKDDEESQRDKIVDMIENNIKQNLFFIDKVIVVSPYVRPVFIGETQKDSMIDEMNEIYRRIILLSNQIKNVSGTLYDILTFKMQQLVKDLYEFVKVKESKKFGVIRSLMLGKRVDFSARAVITPNPELKLGEVGIPMPMACSIFEPFIIYGLVNSPESRGISAEFHKTLKDFLGKELDPELLI
jgi:DNA-directed RNA polymerase beta' subunit